MGASGLGGTVGAAALSLEVTEQTLRCWHEESGGFRGDQAERLNEVEKESPRLGRIVADQALDMAMSKGDATGKRPSPTRLRKISRGW